MGQVGEFSYAVMTQAGLFDYARNEKLWHPGPSHMALLACA